MASPAAKPQPPQPRAKANTDASTGGDQMKNANANAQSKSKTTGKLSLFAKYNALSFRVKLYLWISTAGVAWLADSVSDRIFEQNMIDVEANRRVEMELKRMREAEITLSNGKN
jgi:hypothetical protein